VLLTMLAIALSTPVDLLALQGDKPKTPQKKQVESCWLGEPEIQNPNPGKRRPSHLPPELANVRVQRSVMLLKLCLSKSGEVARVLVLESSGNPDVDKYYTTELSTWSFVPVERNKKKVRSVVPVTVTLYLK
jgi:TonB family protein